MNICVDQLGLSTTLQHARSLGWESILIYDEHEYDEMRQVLYLNISRSCPGIVPDCYCSTKAGHDIVELLSSHAQLMDTWYQGCASHYLPSDLCDLVSLHVNCKIPFRINQMI